MNSRLKVTPVILLFLVVFTVAGQVTFNPVNPRRGDTLHIDFKPDTLKRDQLDSVRFRIYFTGESNLNEDVYLTFPQAYDVILSEHQGIFHGTVVVPANTLAFNGVVIDKNKKTLINNNGEGYWGTIAFSGQPLPGALSSIAELYTSSWDPDFVYHLSRRKGLARELYERDFKLHPQIKRKFYRYYLASFDLSIEEQALLFRRELDHFANQVDLDEWEMMAISRYYSRIGESRLADKFVKQIANQFPKGSWAMQTASQSEMQKILKEKDFQKQKQKYFQYINKYNVSFPDEFTRRIMEGRRGQILKEMVSGFVLHNDLANWFRAVNAMDMEFRANTYNRTAAHIVAMHKSGEKIAPSEAEIRKVVENSLFSYKLQIQDTKLLALAEEVSRRAINIWTDSLPSGRSFIDKAFFTDEDVIMNRKMTKAEFMSNLGEILFLENKYAEAAQVLQQASVHLSGRKNTEISELYISALLKTNNISEALREAETVIKLGYSNNRIDELYKAVSNDFSIGNINAVKTFESELQRELIFENMPKIHFLTAEGVIKDINSLNAAIVVMDFWATWCPPCIEELASMMEVVEHYKDDEKVKFVFVNSEKNTSDNVVRITKFINDRNLNIEPLFMSGVETANALKIEALPTKIVLDPRGKIRFRQVGIRGPKSQQFNKMVALIEYVKTL